MESEPSPEEIETPRRRRRSGRDRHPHGRAWVLALWVVLRFADLPLLWLAFRPRDPVPDFRLSVITSVLWTTALCAALWAKQIWARPFAAVVIGGYACWWSYGVAMLGMYLARAHVLANTELIVLPLIAALLYFAVVVAILRSKNIKYLTDPTEGWRPREV